MGDSSSRAYRLLELKLTPRARSSPPLCPVPGFCSLVVYLSCRNEMLITDLDTDRPQWKLSSYGPSSAGNLVDGKDISPEELRIKMLESNGNQQAYVRPRSSIFRRPNQS